jgi:hypothetical protein
MRSNKFDQAGSGERARRPILVSRFVISALKSSVFTFPLRDRYLPPCLCTSSCTEAAYAGTPPIVGHLYVCYHVNRHCLYLLALNPKGELAPRRKGRADRGSESPPCRRILFAALRFWSERPNGHNRARIHDTGRLFASAFPFALQAGARSAVLTSPKAELIRPW